MQLINVLLVYTALTYNRSVLNLYLLTKPKTTLARAATLEPHAYLRLYSIADVRAVMLVTVHCYDNTELKSKIFPCNIGTIPFNV